MQIFGGSSNQSLVKDIARIGGWTEGKVEIGKFANGETRVWVREPKVERQVVVLQSFSTPTNEHIVEFCLLCDALSRLGAREITAVIPWMGYSKQDKVFRDGEPLSAKVVAQIVQTARLEKIITFDLHNHATLGFFDIPVVELSAKPLLLKYFAGFEGVVVAPDAGAVKASTAFAEQLGVNVVYMDKKRDLATGQVSVVGISGEVEGREVLLVDDNVFTGSTLLETTKELKKRGARRIRVGLTHHLYLPGVQEKLEASEIDEVVVTDTVAQSATSQKYRVESKKLRILSVAGLIVDELS